MTSEDKPVGGAAEGLAGAELRARILAAAAQRPSPTRPTLLRRRAVAILFAVAWMGALAYAMRGNAPEGGALLVAIVWAAVAIFGTGYVLFSPKSSLGRPREVHRALGVALGAFVMAAAYAAGSLFGHESHADGHYVECWVASFTVAVGPLGAMLFVERKSDPVAPGASGAGMGAVAGAWAGVAMSFVCGRTDPAHAFVAHVLALWAIVFVSTVVGRRVLAQG